jgi:hypothetical protein
VQSASSRIDNKPKGFGERPDNYHSDAIFLMDIDAAKAMIGGPGLVSSALRGRFAMG